LILGGGYGLYLKQLHMQQSDLQTLIDGSLWPPPRGTEDLDLFLETEVIAESSRLAHFMAALVRLGYFPVCGAEYYQFVRKVGANQSVKIDLLIGALGRFESDPRLKIDARRVRPRESVQLHAHRTDEAVAFQEGMTELLITGLLSDGSPYETLVYVPQPFTFLLTKLFAFRDRTNDPRKDFARHHALDLYRIVAMLTEVEYNTVRQKIIEYGTNPHIIEAGKIVARDFRSPDALGGIRLREHSLFTSDMDIQGFLSALSDLFTPAAPD